ncbi:membrane protein [Variovorax boronicumulans]|uniref:YihY/virulence factor BrkB family protein n=1 Tax=Variovorax boronicumulans TaxID=436515 RepID=UPI002786D402|nr:YihY/virulence factor BrkB family protein [Variovorax boronicumulans]MDQ0073381.1 membrane protein [Variovorax boronicumulans]
MVDDKGCAKLTPYSEPAVSTSTLKPNFMQLYRLCRDAVTAWIDDFAPSMGAAISYYTMFSLAPLLVIVIAVAGALFSAEAVQGQIAAQLSGLIGEEGALAVQGLVKSASEPSRGLIAGGISIFVLVLGATTVFAELQSALDRIWHVPERVKPKGVWGVLRARVLSFGLILGLAFLLMVSLIVSAGLAAMGSWSMGLFPGWETLLQGLNVLVSLGILTLLFAMIFKFMPSAPIRWHDVWIGAIVTAVLFEVGKVLIGLYLGKSGVNESFAAAGSLVVLLAWVYYAAQIFLLGAEFTKVYATAHGSVAAAKAQAATDSAALQAEKGTDASVHATSEIGKQQRRVEAQTRKAKNLVMQQIIELALVSLVSALLSQIRRNREKPAKLRARSPLRTSVERGRAKRS